MRRIKRFLPTFCLILALVCTDVSAEGTVTASGSCGDNLAWELSDNGVLTIAGTGNMFDYNGATGGPWFQYAESITSVVVEEGVTGIGSWAFAGCRYVTSVIIPDSVTSIGGGVFRSCNLLENIVIGQNNQNYCDIGGVLFDKTGDNLICYPSGKQEAAYTVPSGVEHIRYDAFRECSALESVTLPDSLISLGFSAFYGCRSLTSITIPLNLQSIGGTVFSNCSSLTEITVAEGNTRFESVDGVLFSVDGAKLVAYPAGKSGNTYSIPAEVSMLESGAFGGCISLEKVVIPTGVTEIGAQMFENCSALKEVEMPSGITVIRDNAFAWCTGITSLTIPAGVTGIEGYAFYKCGALTEITIPNSVQSVGEAAFAGCKALSVVNYDGNEVQWGKVTIADYNSNLTNATICFLQDSPGSCGENLTWTLSEGVLTISGEGEMTDFARDSDAPWYEYKSSVKSVVIEHGVTSIGTNAFKGYNTNLKSLTMADSITVIGDAAFNSCVWLSGELNLPDELVTIGDDAFSNCYRMTGVLVIPGKVTTIGKGAFYNTKLSGEVTLPNGLRQIGISAFAQCSQITSVRIPNTVTDIGNQAFYKCTALSYVYIPAAVQTMGEQVFNLSTALKKVGPVGGGYNIEYGWTDAIPDNAFKGNTNIVSVTLPGTLTNIGASAFEGCSKLASIVIPNNVRNMGEYAFKGCSSLSSVTLGSGLTELSANAFSGCGLTAATIPGNITAIGNSAFSGCRQLERVTLEKGIQTIEKEAFTNCVSLVEIILPDTITSVGDYAFSSLERVCIQGGPLATGNAAFNSAAVLYFFDSELWNRGWLDGDNKWIDGRYQEGVTVKWGEDLVNENWEIHAIHAPDFTIQPQSKNVSEGEIVTFTVAITGTPTPSVQWQVNTGNGWGNIPGAVDTSYTISAVTADEHGNRYRCVLVNYGGRTVSNVAEISLIVASGPCGDNLTWTLTADGILTITGTGSMWDFTLETLATWYQYRALIKELVISTGVTRIGAYAFYQCFTSASVTRAIVPGETVGITIGADVESIGECAFGACDTMQSVAFEGEQAPVLAEDAIPESVTLYHEGSDETWGNETTKNYNTVVMEMPKVETSPDDATVAVGKTVTFTAEFTGTPVASLQWQVCEDGQTWDDIRGATNATYTISSAGASLNQVMYRCVATNAAGTAISEAATLSISDVGIVATKTAVTNGILVSVSVGNPFENVKSGAVVCAVYEENGKLLGIATAALTVAAGEDMTTSLTVVCNAAQAAEVKVFFVTTDTYSPICNAEEIA